MRHSNHIIEDVTRPIIALLSTTSRPGIYRCQHKTHIVEHKSPEGRLARRLLVAGYDPTRAFHTRWYSGAPSMKWPSLEDAAAGDVHEDDKGMRWRKHRPFPEGARG